MTTKVLKEELHRLVESTEDNALLLQVYEKLKDKEEETPDWWDQLDKP